MIIQCAGHKIEVTHPDKVLFTDPALTKADLASYYQNIAPFMLPHLQNRPLTLQRFPEGLDESGFIQKNWSDSLPQWITTTRISKTDGSVNHIVVDDAAALIYLANLAMITAHTPLSTSADLHHPDRLIFDLDPSSEGPTAFKDVRFAARCIRERLSEFDLTAFVQTTGSRGLHVVVPIKTSVSFDESRDFAHQLAQALAEQYPQKLTIAQRLADRGQRIFLDYLRNGYSQTAVAPYSLRALPGAPVATPLDWHELQDTSLGPRSYHVKNIFRRLGQKHCPWRDINKHASDLQPAIRALAQR